jgi:hypothetical protein
MEFKLGLVASPIDRRDYLLAAYLPPLTVTLPDEFLDWVPWQTPVKYQAQLGACASFNGVAVKEPYDWKEYGTMPDLSEQFLYGEAKKIDGLDAEGTYLRAIMQVLLDTGVCEESYLPYEGRYPPINSPSLDAYENAKNYKISAYAQVGVTKEEIKRALYQNGPLCIGIKVYQSFMNTGIDGIVQFPSGKELGGHALTVVGYTKLGMLIKNSWSVQWGNKGYCVIPWAVWEQINMGEAWSIVDLILRKKPWEDWLELEPQLGWLVKNSGIFKGYNDGLFHPYDNVSRRQATLIAQRLNFPINSIYLNEYSTLATRGWIHEQWPQYTFLEERWEENLTRFQFAVIIGRYLKTLATKNSLYV